MRTITSPPALPERPKEAHKGRFGHVLLVAGSSGMPGAAALSALAALRSGAGLLTIATAEPLLPLIAPRVPEAMHLPLQGNRCFLAAADAEPLGRFLSERASVLAIGPGIGRSEETLAAARQIVLNCPHPFVLDADGIYAFKNAVESLKSAPAPAVITPHPGEMAALVNSTAADVQRDRTGAVTEAVRRTGKVVVLKGHGTLVAVAGAIYQNPTGGPALAKGGAGDVLTGMAAAFLAQGMGPFEAAVLAVYLHGLAGDLAARALGAHSVLGRDIIEYIPTAMKVHCGAANGA